MHINACDLRMRYYLGILKICRLSIYQLLLLFCFLSFYISVSTLWNFEIVSSSLWLNFLLSVMLCTDNLVLLVYIEIPCILFFVTTTFYFMLSFNSDHFLFIINYSCFRKVIPSKSYLRTLNRFPRYSISHHK